VNSDETPISLSSLYVS